MKDHFKREKLDRAAALAGFESHPASKFKAEGLLDMHEAVLKAFDALGARLAPILSMKETFGKIGVSLGELEEMAGMRGSMAGAVEQLNEGDQKIQEMGIKGVAWGLVGVSLALRSEGVESSREFELVGRLRKACFESIPKRCVPDWELYVSQIELAAASVPKEGSEHGKAQSPRL
jgi:hypothetical protein